MHEVEWASADLSSCLSKRMHACVHARCVYALAECVRACVRACVCVCVCVHARARLLDTHQLCLVPRGPGLSVKRQGNCFLLTLLLVFNLFPRHVSTRQHVCFSFPIVVMLKMMYFTNFLVET